MTNSPFGNVSDASPPDSDGDRDRWWPMLTSSFQRSQAIESTTLTALLLLLIVATTDRQKALPTTGRVLNLVCELQHDHTGAQSDAKLRASVISQLSEALAGLRRTLN
jgi:hypothetical protein